MGERNMQFKDLTTFKIGGPIKHFFEVKSDKEIIKAGEFAKKNNLKIFILGGGSDILVNDKGFDGVVVKYTGKKLKVKSYKLKVIITAEAGMAWDELVKFSVEHNLQGLECMSGIPGTVGASPIQNIGAYGEEVKDTLLSLRAFEFKSGKFLNFSNKDCEFGYRESFFKKPENWQKYLITSVSFKFKKYKDIDLSLQNIRDEILRVRGEKLENPKEVGNAGSFFKNPIVEGHKISAGLLIDKAGWKGKSYKSAAVSAKNALILINKSGEASSSDVYELSKLIINDVKKKFGITLEPEVQFVGFERKVAILGYGLEGQDAERYFKNKKAKIKILDQKFDKDYLKNLGEYDLVVRSPGVYPYKPELKNINVTTPIQIFFDNCPARIIGVTGTKGKGTTSTLIYEILKNAGKDIYLAGNIGKPYLELLPIISPTSYIVLELSSFQLIDLTKSPHIAVVLNITLDHMDWHKSREEYVSSKKNIVRYQTVSDLAIINSEYEVPKSFSDLTRAKVILFSKSKLEKKYKENLLLRGEHNLENIAAAVSVSKVLGIKEDIILKSVREFKGLEHRLELVKEVGGVTFYNDSFATGPQPTIAAIRSFAEPITLILGGSDKGLSYDELGKEIAANKQVNKVIIIGQVGPLIIRSLNGAGFRGSIINLRLKPMVKIVENAFRNTPRGGVVLLSPAAASFDMFKNYKDRGSQFKEAVQNLK